MKKIGRNQPCHCGSGKKYKRCHWLEPTSKELEDMRQEIVTNQIMDAKILSEKGIYIDFARPTIFEGRKVWAIGSRLYPNEPLDQTFTEFLLSVLQQELGKDWWKEEGSKPKKDQHYIYKSYGYFIDWVKREKPSTKNESDGTKSAFPDGWSWSLLSLAFDIALLIHSDSLPVELLDRLKRRDSYQGTRYEIAIASIFSRIGCNIDFIENKNNTEKHPEFYATTEDNYRVAVEVKSRHRKGVIHQAGISTPSELLKTRIVPNINEAIQQNPRNMPFIIFIDLNQPPDFIKSSQEQVDRFKKSTGQLAAPSRDNPDKFSLLYITNFSGHYIAEKEMPTVFSTHIIPLFSSFPLNKPELIKRLSKAVENYGFVPGLTPHGIKR